MAYNRLISVALALSLAAAYDNGSPARLPPMGWSSWIALGPGATPPIFDYCDEQSVKNSIDAFVELGFPELGWKHIHLDECVQGAATAAPLLSTPAANILAGCRSCRGLCQPKTRACISVLARWA